MRTANSRRQREGPEFGISFRAALWILLLLVGFSSTSPAAVRVVEDPDITNAIEMELWGNPAVPSNQIDVKSKNGIVTFTGRVGHILAKERVEKIAETIIGVRAVVNRIDVVPPFSLKDEEIKNAVEEALFDDPATDSYETKVQVDAGIVKLTGTVDSWQEKQLCTTVAKGVKGVREVKNEIRIDYKTARSDHKIEQEVKARLANDVLVDDTLINVTVQDEKVSLTGTVGSLAEKNRAFSDAWVGGVDSVNTDGLDIEWWARDEMRRKSLFVSRTDEEIWKAVKDAFRYDPRVFSFNPDVDVRDGTIILSGIVQDLAAKKAAERDARNTLGVQRVINNLKVRPINIPPNDDLETKVSRVFIGDPHVERFKLNISANNGTVFLAGQVNTSWEKDHAERIVQRIKGVVNVVNNIDFDHQWAWKPDWQIREDVKDQLFWSPYVDEEQVSVTVKNGVVMLTGNVETWNERKSAEINAYEGGLRMWRMT